MMAPQAEAPADLGTALDAAVTRLRAAGSPSPRLDAELLVGHAVGRGRAWVVAHPEAPLPADAATRLEDSVQRRAAGEPVAYIRGFKEWFSLRVTVDRRALIPRPETELLAEAAIRELDARLADHGHPRPVVAWDVGTGSGAIALAITLRFRSQLGSGSLRLIASDLARDAVALARDNLAAYGVDRAVELLEIDLLAPAGRELPRPALVVANLPYIPSHEVDRLPVAASFEPRLALDGGSSGLDPVGRLVEQLPDALAPGGAALQEDGADQAEAIARLAESASLHFAGSLSDLAGIARVVRLERSGDRAPGG